MHRVFICDDELWIILGLKNLIDWQKEGFVICGEASDGVKAWERIRKLEPDLILSDIRMPGMDGIELLKTVKQAEMSAETVIISGYSDFQYAKVAMQYGCMDYLLKPIDEDELLDCLRRVKQTLDMKNPEKALTEEREEPSEAYQSDARILKEMQQYIQENF